MQTGLGSFISNIGASRTVTGQKGLEYERVNQNPLASGIGGFVGKYGLSTALGLGAVAPRLAEGDLTGAAATAGGAIAGALLTKGSPIGTVIGAAIADSFYQNVVARKTDFANVLANAFSEGVDKTEKEDENTAKAAGDKAVKAIWESFLNPWIAEKSLALLNPLMNIGVGIGTGGKVEGLTPEQYALVLLQKQYGGVDSPKFQNLLKQQQKAKTSVSEQTAQEIPLDQTAVFKYEKMAKVALGPAIDAIVKTQQETLRKQLISGEITPKVYKDKLTETTGMPSTLIRMIGATNNMSTSGASSELNRYAALFANIGSEEKQILTDLTTQWYDLSKQIEDTKNMTDEAFRNDADKEALRTVGDIRKEYADVTQQVRDYTAAMEAANKVATAYEYQFMNNVTEAQYQSIMPEYNKIRGQILNAGGKSEETELLTYFKDSNSPSLMKADWQIVQYLLGEILKTDEKQLDGIYNLPSGASFYVPYQAWKMDTETRQAMGTGETGKLDASQFNGGVEVFGVYIDRFGNFIQNLANNLTNAQKKEVNTTASEMKFSAKYKDWNMQKALQNQPAMVDQYGRPTIGPGSSTPINPSLAPNITGTNLFGGLYSPNATPVNPNNIFGGLTNPNSTAVPPINTNFTLNLNSQTQLIVDGRTLADVIKPYLESDQLSSEGSMNSTVSMTVI